VDKYLSSRIARNIFNKEKLIVSKCYGILWYECPLPGNDCEIYNNHFSTTKIALEQGNVVSYAIRAQMLIMMSGV
jgi:hypothetical protein